MYRKPPKTVYVSGRPFIRGPLPLDWFLSCKDMSGKTLMLALAIWWKAGMEGRQNIKLSTTALRPFGVDRKAKDRALKALEQAGLISVARRQGSSPLVTIITENIDKPG